MKKAIKNIRQFGSSPYLPLGMMVLLMALGGFANRKAEEKEIQDLDIRIHNLHENHYVNEEDLLEILSHKNQLIVGEGLGDVKLKEIEKDLTSNPYISEAEVFGNFQGIVNLEVWLRRPMIRVIQPDGRSVYVSQDGVVLPTSDKYSSRVILLSGKGTIGMEADSFWIDDYSSTLMDMIRFIQKDKFWDAQISQLEVEEDGELVIIPQVTKQKVSFGRPEDYERKFKKLMVFYDRILPQKGWNYYTEVNLKFNNQIICY